MPFSTPLDLQQLMGFLCTFNVVLPWDHIKFGETTQTDEIQLEAPEESLNFQDWGPLDYGLELRMKLSAYREEILSREASFHIVRRLNTHMPFMLGSQFSCLATQETQFHKVIDKHVLYQKANCCKGKDLLIEDDEDAPSIRLVKARCSHVFKHELKALKQKTELTNMDWYAMKMFYRL